MKINKRLKNKYYILLLAFLVCFLLIITYQCHSLKYVYSYSTQVLIWLYAIFIFITIFVIDIEKLTKKDMVIALSLGLISIGIIIPISIIGCFSGLCTSCTYLASKSVSYNYKNNICFICSKKFKFILLNIGIIFLYGGFIATYKIVQGNLSIQHDISTKIFVKVFISALGAGISEEIIYRFFVYSIMLHLNRGKEPYKVLAYIIMIVPFAMLHIIDIISFNDFYQAFPMLVNVCITILPCTLIAMKRDVFTAIGIHFIYDFVIILFS